MSYRHGESGLLDYLDAQGLQATMQEYNQAFYELEVAVASLEGQQGLFSPLRRRGAEKNSLRRVCVNQIWRILMNKKIILSLVVWTFFLLAAKGRSQGSCMGRTSRRERHQEDTVLTPEAVKQAGIEPQRFL